jgi:hypothetical protein
VSEKTPFPESLSNVIDMRIVNRLDTSPFSLGAIKCSVLDGKIEVFKTLVKNHIGYVAWTTVTKETFVLMTKTKSMPAYAYEWNEGKLMVIHDVLFLQHWNKMAKAMLMDFLRKQRFIAFIRRGKVHVWSKNNNKFKKTVY